MKPENRPFLVAACAFLFIIQATYFAMAFPGAIRGRADFSTLYTAGFMTRTGHGAELYDYDSNTRFQERLIGASHGPVPFNHMAYETLLFAPLSLLSYRTAYAVFLAVNLGLLSLSLWMLNRYTKHLRELWAPLPAATFACFLPVGIAGFQGQDSILILALFACAYAALENGYDLRAGIFLGLTLFKFQFCLPIVLLYLAWRKWRVVSGFIGTAAVVAGISISLTGLGRILVYVHYLSSVSSRLGSNEQLKYAIYPLAMPNIFGLVFAIGGNHTFLTGIISCAVVALVSRGRPSFPIAVVVAMLVSYHGLIHDASILVIPILLIAEAALQEKSPRFGKLWVSLSVLAYPTLAVCFVLPYCLLAVPIMGFLGGGDRTSRASAKADPKGYSAVA